MRVAAVALFVVAAVAAVNEARASDPKQCLEAAESAQRLRTEGKLRAATQALAQCQSPECPALVQQDCSRWATEVAAALPTVVVDARDARGRDLADVIVKVDGEVLVSTIDGRATPIDPGPHTIVYEHAGSEPVSENVIVKEGVKARRLVVTFADRPSPSVSSPPVESRRHSAAPWVLVGVGGAVAVAGVTLILVAPPLPFGCSEATELCTRIAGESSASLEMRQEEAGRHRGMPIAGGIAIGVGGAAIVGGLLWHFLEPTGPRRGGLRVAPWAHASGAGFGASGSFD
ncbi:MAG: hypothetical protein JST00_19115 [Deltaproteobacteria bacterium]|nr:hypothetical protein [Deltaproteobacteria bacterium]